MPRRKTWESFRADLLAIYQPPLYSPATRSKLRQVLDLVGGMAAVRGPADLGARTVAEFAVERSKVCRPRTVNGELDYLRIVCNHAEAEGYLPRSPFAVRRYRLRDGETSRTRPLTREEIARLLAHLDVGRESWEGARLHALACLVAYTGLRKREALCLKVGDVELVDGFLRVVPRQRLKTVGSAAPVPLADQLLPILAKWLPRTGSEWAFPGVRQKGPWVGGLAGTRALDRLRMAGESIGIPGATFLALRHSWATHAEFWQIGELTVQRVLRHTTPLTQRHYRHPDLVNLRQAVRGINFEGPPPHLAQPA